MAEEAALTRACPGALLDTNHDGVRKFHMRHQPGWTLTGADELVVNYPPPPLRLPWDSLTLSGHLTSD